MHFRVALVALLPLTLASPFSFLRRSTTAQLEERNEPCLTSGVHMIVASGHGAQIFDGYGLLNTTVDSVLLALPGSTNFSIPFPKNDEDEASAVGVGQTHFTNNLERYVARCPNDPIVVIGYSEGAVIAMNSLCGRSHIGAPFGVGIPSNYSENIIATILYGDETRVPDQPYNRGTCKTGEGINPRGNPAGCGVFELNMRSYCDAPDPECCGGTNLSVHFTYPATYNERATKFIVKQYTATLP